MSGAADDRIVYWPILLAVVGPLVTALLWTAYAAFKHPLLLLPVLCLIPMVWALIGIGAVIICFFSAYERAWRRLASTLVLPAAVLLAGLNFWPIWSATQTAGTYVHFFLMYRQMRADIEGLPAGAPRFLVWDWEPAYTVEVGIAYDDSDEIASNHPSEGWKQAAREFGIVGSGYRPLYGHFYLVELADVGDTILEQKYAR